MASACSAMTLAAWPDWARWRSSGERRASACATCARKMDRCARAAAYMRRAPHASQAARSTPSNSTPAAGNRAARQPAPLSMACTAQASKAACGSHNKAAPPCARLAAQGRIKRGKDKGVVVIFYTS
ncbi:hypothetical protein VM94_02454 [Janthinobacterium sp. KBS0711]|nr:hypothetical protein VM94_02454 [Janthinobacterium sp. KBS0711]